MAQPPGPASGCCCSVRGAGSSTWSSSDHTTFLVVAVVLAVLGFTADSLIYVLFGVAAGITWFWALRRRPEQTT